MKLVEFQVTAEDIAKGEHNYCSGCPVALAIQRAGFPGVMVGRYRATFPVAPPQLTMMVDLPPTTQDNIHRFDHLGGMEPFSFNLYIPQEVLDFQGKDKV